MVLYAVYAKRIADIEKRNAGRAKLRQMRNK